MSEILPSVKLPSDTPSTKPQTFVAQSLPKQSMVTTASERRESKPCVI